MSLRAALLLLLALAAAPAEAHNRGTSYSDWTLDDNGGRVQMRIGQLELTRLALDPRTTPDYASRAADLLAGSLQLWAGTTRCEARDARAEAGADGWLRAEWSLQCPPGGARVIRSQLLRDAARAHLHFARVQRGAASPGERVLSFAEPDFVLDAPRAAPATLASYVVLGLEHIWSGWDHLAFVLALVLLAARLREVALVATGFTLAHSLTLAAAVLGWVAVDGVAVEALIGLSIALVAAENLWLRGGRERWLPWLLTGVLALLAASGATPLPPLLLGGLALFVASYFALLRDSAAPQRLRFAVACIFGLVHGFGFAGALAPLQLPPERLALGLGGFNLGVELGQLAVIALAWPLLRGLARRPQAQRWAVDGASAAICALGTFWFVSRAFA